MSLHTEQSGWERSQAALKESQLFFPIGAALIFLLIGVAVGAYWFRAKSDDYALNLFTDFMNIAITVFILDRVNEYRRKQAEERQLKEQLIRDAGSTSNEIAKNAVHQLRKQGLLIGGKGALAGQDLFDANLADARLGMANLQAARLEQANLERSVLWGTYLLGANLHRANLRCANLENANLQGVNLSFADLQGIKLRKANLQGANLTYARLQGAKLGDANVEGANFWHAEFDTTTILPDGNPWISETDISRFGGIFVSPSEQFTSKLKEGHYENKQ